MLINLPPYNALLGQLVSAPVGGGDYLYNYVKLLVKPDGNNGGTELTDLKGHALTRVGTTPIVSTTAAKNGNASLRTTNNAEYFRVPAASEFTFNGDFCVEAWFLVPALPSTWVELVATEQVSGSECWGIELGGNGAIGVYASGPTETNHIYTGAGAVAAGVWHHVAYTRTGSTASFWFNGNLVGQKTISTPVGTGYNICLGGRAANAGTGTVYLDDIRITNGAGRYTAAFTPPATMPEFASVPYSAVKLLMHMDGGNGGAVFTDMKAKPFTLAGTPRTSTLKQKFGTASTLFNAQGQYLKSVAHADWNLNGSDFQVDMWVNPSTAPSNAHLIGTANPWYGSGDAGVGGWGLRADVNALVFVANGTTQFSQPITWDVNQWQLITWARLGSTYYYFKNGELLGSTTAGVTPADTTSALYIGGNPDHNTQVTFLGNIDEVRLIKGYALNTATFTPETQAYVDYDLPPTSAIVSVLNFDGENGSKIYTDETGKTYTTPNDGASLTIGLDTSVKKFGTASLRVPNLKYLESSNFENDFNFAGDFTVEGWYRFAQVVSPGAQYNGDFFSFHGATKTYNPTLFYWNGDYSINARAALTGDDIKVTMAANVMQVGVWYHMAMTKKGNNWYIYLNGNLIGTGVNANVLAEAKKLRLGGGYLDGHFDGVVLTKWAKYQGDPFTPPTQAPTKG